MNSQEVCSIENCQRDVTHKVDMRKLNYYLDFKIPLCDFHFKIFDGSMNIRIKNIRDWEKVLCDPNYHGGAI